jgi:hypothetical protein
MTANARKVLRRCGALLLGSTLTVLVLECGYRVARAPGLSPTTNPSYVRHDAQLGWSYRPGARERHQTSEFDVEVEINARGFRGEAWGAKSGARPRVLVLGDSFAFGWGVAASECFSARLQRSEPRWEVLNAAVSGYGTDQQLLLLERLLPDVQPDLVVAVFCDNDLLENSSPVVYGKHKPYFVVRDGELELRGVPVPQAWLERVSYLARAVSKSAWERALRERRPDPDRDWLLTCQLYRRMQRVLGSVPLLIVSDEQRLADLAREERTLHHLDLRPVFAREARELFFPLDGHWNARAHGLVAEALASGLGPLLP